MRFSHFIVIVYIVGTAKIDAFSSENAPAVCSSPSCPQTRTNQSEVVKYCLSSNTTGTLILAHSCCLNITGHSVDVLGLDLTNCDLKTVTGHFAKLDSLQVIMLENNTGLKIQDTDFNGLTQLKYLSLPLTSDCPGGNASWEQTGRMPDAVICQDEINLCNNNITCSNNYSHCVLLGPGDIQCLCLPGYHGYKCLRQGTFPTFVYLVTLGGCVLVISIWLWCTQRRKVKAKPHRQ